MFWHNNYLFIFVEIFPIEIVGELCEQYESSDENLEKQNPFSVNLNRIENLNIKQRPIMCKDVEQMLSIVTSGHHFAHQEENSVL
jgi:hypothetical protein